MYPGWNSSTHTTTGPIQVNRQYWPAAGSGYLYYTESLTASATPGLNSSNLPDGSESLTSSNIQSLSRDFLNNGGELTWSDAYFYIGGLTYSQTVSLSSGVPADLGTSGTNFYRTTYGYTDLGLVDRVLSPTGTINRTVYDTQGRVISRWVGTDDTPTSGYWSPTNTAGTNMIEVEDDQYDNDGVGDGNLTQVTQHVSQGYANTVLADSPIAYWRLGESSGTSAADASGNGNTGTYTGSYTQGETGAIAGDADTAAQFSGGHVNITTGAALQPSTLSIEAWVYPTSRAEMGIYGQYNTTGSYFVAFTLYLNATTGTIQFVAQKDNVGNNFVLTSSAAVPLNAWSHVAATFDGTTATIYLDGVNVGSVAASYSTLSYASPANTAIGAVNVTGLGMIDPWAGMLDEVALYGSGLTAAQVLAHYQAAITPTTRVTEFLYDFRDRQVAEKDGVRSLLPTPITMAPATPTSSPTRAT